MILSQEDLKIKYKDYSDVKGNKDFRMNPLLPNLLDYAIISQTGYIPCLLAAQANNECSRGRKYSCTRLFN